MCTPGYTLSPEKHSSESKLIFQSDTPASSFFFFFPPPFVQRSSPPLGCGGQKGGPRSRLLARAPGTHEEDAREEREAFGRACLVEVLSFFPACNHSRAGFRWIELGERLKIELPERKTERGLTPRTARKG